MAIAGRVAMIPKGDYDATVTYQILDVVRYNDASYVAKQASTGILPTDTEYWMLMTQDGLKVDDELNEESENPVQNKVVAKEFSDLKNGTAPVGNSNKLGGKEASEYVNRVNMTLPNSFRKRIIALCSTSDANTSNDSISAGTIILHRNNGLATSQSKVDVAMCSDYTKANGVICSIFSNAGDLALPTPCTFSYNGMIYGGLEITISNSATETIEFYGFSNFDIFALEYYNTQTNTALNEEVYNSISYDNVILSPTYVNNEKIATTADLENCMTKDSSTTQVVSAPTSVPVSLKNKTSGGATCYQGFWADEQFLGFLGFSATNEPAVVNTAGSYYPLIHTGNIASKALPISGGTVTGYMYFNETGGRPVEFYRDDSDLVLLKFKGLNGDLGFIGFDGIENLVFLNKDANARYTIHHDGNSAKVVQATSAPSDTTVVWIDTTNKKVKAYIDGAWTALA